MQHAGNKPIAAGERSGQQLGLAGGRVDLDRPRRGREPPTWPTLEPRKKSLGAGNCEKTDGRGRYGLRENPARQIPGRADGAYNGQNFAPPSAKQTYDGPTLHLPGG